MPATRETWVWSLGLEDPLEEDMANHSSMLAWEIPWKEEPCGLWSMGLQRDGHDWGNLARTYKVLLNLFFYFIFFFSLFHLSAIQGKTSMAPGFEAKSEDSECWWRERRNLENWIMKNENQAPKAESSWPGEVFDHWCWLWMFSLFGL